MKQTLKEYRKTLDYIIKIHLSAELAIERFGKALLARGHQISEDELWEAEKAVMDSREKATIGNITRLQEWATSKLDPFKKISQEDLDEIRLDPEFVFQVLHEKQILEAMEPHKQAPKEAKE